MRLFLDHLRTIPKHLHNLQKEMERDLYSVLGVSKGAETSEIRTAYKQLAKEHHPDKGGDPEKFKELSQAHEVLSNEERRKMYDITGSISEQGSGGGGPGGPFGGMPFPMSEMFGGMFGGIFPGGPGPMGGMGMRQGRREGKAPGKSQDLPLRISDYYNGRTLSVKLGRHSFCKICKGSGAASTTPCTDCGGQGQVRQMINMGPIQMLSQSPCHPCQGKGTRNVGSCSGCQGRGLLPDEKSLEIKVEPGMMSGNTIVFTGMCSDSQGYTEPGDVTIVLREADEEDDAKGWVREGTKLKTSITINLTESLLGTTKVLKGHPGFPNGIPVEIPAGVQNMWTGTIPTLGMPVRGTPKFGEAYISVLVIPTPEELATLNKQSVLLKTVFTDLPVVPECPEPAKSGRWGTF